VQNEFFGASEKKFQCFLWPREMKKEIFPTHNYGNKQVIEKRECSKNPFFAIFVNIWEHSICE